MKVIIEIECSGIIRENPTVEVAKILAGIAQDLEKQYHEVSDQYHFPLFDANGNNVGIFKVV